MEYIQLVLFYNHYLSLPFCFSNELSKKRWRVTTDRQLFRKANIIVFHLPSLAQHLATDLEKQEGQLWIGWRLEHENNIQDSFHSVWDKLFDFYISYSPQCYWECMTTYGKASLQSKKNVFLLESIASWWKKVDFMLIGTQKGGSTALHEYLSQHPSCWGSYYKEPGFFLFPGIYTLGLSWYMGKLWKEETPLRYSLAQNLLFESTSWYCYWHEVPQRLFEYNPDLKLIFLIRNPIERAYSQYNMLIHWSKEKILYEYSLYPDKRKLNLYVDQLLDTQQYPFSYWTHLEIEKIETGQCTPEDFFPDFLHRGFYYEQLSRFYHFFPKEQLMIIESNELKNKRIEILKQIELFLNIPSVNWDEKDLSERFTSQYNNHISDEMQEKLATFFEPYNDQLYLLINKNYHWK